MNISHVTPKFGAIQKLVHTNGSPVSNREEAMKAATGYWQSTDQSLTNPNMTQKHRHKTGLREVKSSDGQSSDFYLITGRHVNRTAMTSKEGAALGNQDPFDVDAMRSTERRDEETRERQQYKSLKDKLYNVCGEISTLCEAKTEGPKQLGNPLTLLLGKFHQRDMLQQKIAVHPLCDMKLY